MVNKKKKGSNKVIWVLLIVVVAILAFAIIGKQAGIIGGPSTLEVQMAKVKTATIIEKVTASGVVQPITEVPLSPDVAGEIIELNVEEGDYVNEGMILVKIRPDNLQSALDRARANLNQQLANLASSKADKARSDAQLEQSRLAYERAKTLNAKKVTSDADLETAESNYLTAKFNLEAAMERVKAAEFTIKSSQATVEEAAENLRLTVVRSPMSGTVSKLDVEKGERVVGTQQMAGTEMMRIANLNEMEVEVDVNENDIIRVHIGDTAEIDVDSYSQMEKKFSGVVTAIANTANTRTSPDAVTEFKVKVKIFNDSFGELRSEIQTASPFRPGMTASVEIFTTTRKDVLSVPLSAVTTRIPGMAPITGEDGEDEPTFQTSTVSTADKKVKEVVFLNDGGKAKMVEVTTGISDFDNIEVLSGLNEGDEIVSGPFFVVSKRIKEGDLIEAKPAPNAVVVKN